MIGWVIEINGKFYIETIYLSEETNTRFINYYPITAIRENEQIKIGEKVKYISGTWSKKYGTSNEPDPNLFKEEKIKTINRRKNKK